MGLERPAAKIGAVAENSAAYEVGLQKGDKILAIDGVKIQSFDAIAPLITLKPTILTIERGGEISTLTIKPKLEQGYNEFGQIIPKAKLGIAPSNESVMVYHKEFWGLKYALDESLRASTLIIKGIIKLIDGEVEAKNLGGIITMTDLTAKAAGVSFSLLLLIAALISVNLGILNLLPIPMLDGGHICFNLYEMIFRRKIHPKAFEYLSYGGMAVLLSLMLFATFNDIMRAMGKF